MNLLHSIKAYKDNDSINVVVEIPAGSQSKIEYDHQNEVFVVDRFLYTNFTYPFNYGFIPETWSDDNDPLDVTVVSSQSVPSGSLLACRVIGMLITKDEKGSDSKIIAVPNSKIDPSLSKINSIEELGEKNLDRIQYFYKNYKIIEPGKWVDIDGYSSKEEAERKINQAIEQYHQHFQTKK